MRKITFFISGESVRCVQTLWEDNRGSIVKSTQMFRLGQFKLPRERNLDVTLVGEIPLEEPIVSAIENCVVISFEMCSAETITAWLPSCKNASTYNFKYCDLPPNLEKLSQCNITIQDCDCASVSLLGKHAGLVISLPQLNRIQPGKAAHLGSGLFVGGRANEEESTGSSYITPEDVAAFNGAQNLFLVGIQRCVLTKGVLEAVTTLNSENIELFKCKLVSGLQFEDVQDNSATSSVYVRESPIPIEVLAKFLRSFKNLASLSLSNLEIRGSDFNLLSNLTIKEIDLRHCDIFEISPSKWPIDNVHLRLSQITDNPLLKEVFSESEVEIDDWDF